MIFFTFISFYICTIYMHCLVPSSICSEIQCKLAQDILKFPFLDILHLTWSWLAGSSSWHRWGLVWSGLCLTSLLNLRGTWRIIWDCLSGNKSTISDGSAGSQCSGGSILAAFLPAATGSSLLYVYQGLSSVPSGHR